MSRYALESHRCKPRHFDGVENLDGMNSIARHQDSAGTLSVRSLSFKQDQIAGQHIAAEGNLSWNLLT